MIKITTIHDSTTSLFSPWIDGVVAKENEWKKVDRLNEHGRSAGVRHCIRCSGSPDLFDSSPELLRPRARLINTIHNTIHIDWILAVDNPDSIAVTLMTTMEAIRDTTDEPYWYAKGVIDYWLAGKPPLNVKVVQS